MHMGTTPTEEPHALIFPVHPHAHGDWDGDGADTVGFFDPAASVFMLRNALTTGFELMFGYGSPAAGWQPLCGCWEPLGVDAKAVDELDLAALVEQALS